MSLGDRVFDRVQAVEEEYMIERLLNMIFGKPGHSLSQEAKEISDSLHALKTLRCQAGQVSVSLGRC